MTWDGKERRREQREGMEGRRSSDWHCPDHNMIQESTKEHRSLVCGKIAGIKADAEHDLEALKAYHDKDLEELKLDLGDKAGKTELRGISRLVSIMVSLAIIAIGAQAVWLKGDNRELRDAMRADITEVGSQIKRLNQRVSETVSERVATDLEQTKQLESIAGKIEVVNWRLSQLEEQHRTGK